MNLMIVAAAGLFLFGVAFMVFKLIRKRRHTVELYPAIRGETERQKKLRVWFGNLRRKFSVAWESLSHNDRVRIRLSLELCGDKFDKILPPEELEQVGKDLHDTSRLLRLVEKVG